MDIMQTMENDYITLSRTQFKNKYQNPTIYSYYIMKIYYNNQQTTVRFSHEPPESEKKQLKKILQKEIKKNSTLDELKEQLLYNNFAYKYMIDLKRN